MTRKDMEIAFKGVFREEAWATPLLALSVIVLCVLLLYTVLCFCSWIKPSPRKSATLLPWLQLPLLIGLMCLASTAIVAAVPFSDPSCRLLFIGPGVSYVLLVAGLMSRINQQSIRTHVVLQWLLMFFVVLNQVVISAAYLAHTSSKKACRATVNDQLLMMLYPGLLVAVVLLLVYRTTRRTKSEWKSKEAVHVGLAATFTGAFAACWLSAAAVLGDALLAPCMGYGCLATAVVISLISLVPRQEHSADVYADGFYKKNGVLVHESPSSHNHQMLNKRSERPAPPKAEPAFNEPEIIIVPVTPDGQMLPDNAIKVSSTQLQRMPSRRVRESVRRHRHHHHHHHNHSKATRPASPRQQKWHSRLRSEWTLAKRLKTLRKRKEPVVREFGMTIKESKASPRTPYNHRGWLY